MGERIVIHRWNSKEEYAGHTIMCLGRYQDWLNDGSEHSPAPHCHCRTVVGSVWTEQNCGCSRHNEF